MVYNNFKRGISIVEVIIVSAVVTIFFIGLFGSFRYTLELVSNSKSKQTATSVALNQIEYIRSLSYDAVGTVSGIPSGLIPQVSTSSLNGIDFTITTLIEYIDSPADGEGLNDDNNITTDYKQAKVTVAWEVRGVEKELFMISTIIPRSIETDVGGGTLRVNIFDADVNPVPNAEVRLVNNSLVPNIDVTKTANADGVALFGGAPAGAGYEIFVTKSGFSSDGTRAITAGLVNPSTPPATVAEADVTTMNFFIDETSEVLVRTVSGLTAGTWLLTDFASTTIATSSFITATSSGIKLLDTAGTYAGSGLIVFNPVTPASLAEWGVLNVSETVPALTARSIHIYSEASTTTMIPDVDLPGNSVGFTNSTIDLSLLDVSTYPSLSVGVRLQTASTTVTPTVSELELTYTEAFTPISNVNLNIEGSKVVGTDSLFLPVLKYSTTSTSDGAGELILSNMEWDTYNIIPAGYRVVEACPALPLSLLPGNSETLTLTLGSQLATALRVQVLNNMNEVVAGASVTLSRPGYNSTLITSSCGQVSFASPSNQSDFALEVELGGVVVWSATDFVVSGDDSLVIQLP